MTRPKPVAVRKRKLYVLAFTSRQDAERVRSSLAFAGTYWIKIVEIRRLAKKKRGKGKQ